MRPASTSERGPRGGAPGGSPPLRPLRGGGEPPERRQVVSNAVFGTLIFVICEAMLFAGMISAFTIVRTSSLGAWPPPGQPRLPAGETLINTAALLASGALLWAAHRAFARDPARARWPLLASMLLGAFFVAFQGAEWMALIREGLTLTSSNHGSFFYLIVGTHALHAIAALIALVYVWSVLLRGSLAPERFYAAQIFWYFVVGVWPILYWRVYL